MKYTIHVFGIIVIILSLLFDYSYSFGCNDCRSFEQKIEFCENMANVSRFINLHFVYGIRITDTKSDVHAYLESLEMDIPEIESYFYRYIDVIYILYGNIVEPIRSRVIQDVSTSIYDDCVDDLITEEDFK